MTDIAPERMEIHRTSIPMRTFEHAAAARDNAEAIVVRVIWPDGRQGWGETLPREYVTGETLESVIEDLQERVFPAMRRGGELPHNDTGGRCMSAAACALDLAGYDALTDDPPTDTIVPRVSGVLGSSDPAKTARKLRHMRLFGLKDFKLKLGFDADVDRENLKLVAGKLAKGIQAGRLTLRVDVNGGWSPEETPERIDELVASGVCVVEQPTYCSAGELVELARRCSLPLMADESLITIADAETLLSAGDKIWWNIRLSKNGGIRTASQLAAMAFQDAIPFVVGCMVGESSILSAAQRRFLVGSGGAARFVEGNYGRFLLTDDLTVKSIRFGYGGRLKTIRRRGLGVQADPKKLARYGSKLT
ncbi:MAG: enolase C-terminal domain-like protein [Phycisphaerae bacterium]|jgi:muconate cycloisomerase|nr:enolase C-terminal domain-like protein [Phycisphaerae bacterium]